MCGASLVVSDVLRFANDERDTPRPESPGPQTDNLRLDSMENLETLKFSFRGGGDKLFQERLKNAMIQRKWLVRDAPPIPNSQQAPSTDVSEHGFTTVASLGRPLASSVGIAGLEQRDVQNRKNNEVVIGSAFEDLEALMASAKTIVALAEKFAVESAKEHSGSTETNNVFSESAAALGIVTTRDMLKGSSDSLYLSELSRNLAEYVTDDRRGILRGDGGIMSLVDLWAVFNRSRNGVELISPLDFQKAAQLWEKLKLPVKLRRFQSGLMVVQRFDWTDEKTLNQLKVWLEDLRESPPDTGVTWDWSCLGWGVTAQEAAQRFGWSIGVATEELEMAENSGLLCREESIVGLKFWLNHFLAEPEDQREHEKVPSLRFL